MGVKKSCDIPSHLKETAASFQRRHIRALNSEVDARF
jgi:hypothetical protein